MKKLIILLLPFAFVCSCGKVEQWNDYNTTLPPYEVGDIYNSDGKKGIVFYVTDGGQHGKIFSFDKTECYWSTENVETGATDENDGMANMRKIQSILDWHEKYPAFAWCADKGADWYLPAINELKTMYESNILKKLSFEKYYWSSNEYEVDWCAWLVDMYDGSTSYVRKSEDRLYVRAVCAF